MTGTSLPIKVRPSVIRTDLCQTSLDLLVSACSAQFSKTAPGEAVWFPDYPMSVTPQHPGAGPVNVVLFGSFVRAFMLTGNWTHPSYRLWALSPSVKSVLSQVLEIREEHIGVIPRDTLFPKATRAIPLPRASNPFTFVYAGRISATKNIEQLLRGVHALQTEWGIDAGLELYGAGDDEAHPDRGRWSHSEYESRMKAIAGSLSWKIPPRFFGKVSPEAWLETSAPHPVFISLSTYVSEDFGVSLAQAQSRGWPCVVSDWGGHRDATGTNLVHVPVQSIGHSHEPSELIRLRSRALAFRIRQALDPAASPHRAEKQSTPIPQPITLSDLDHSRREWIAKTRGAGQLIASEGIPTFADTQEGQAFFRKYRDLFSGAAAAPCVAIVVSEVDPEVERECDRILSERFARGEDVVVASVEDTRQNYGASSLASAKELLVLGQASPAKER